ncbi:MAG: hypothetical protein HY248_04775, partial [Fimbriimonas ginsengisoli]|nr:hypothetical protein [Fimbriimonas ginsengisoli]
MMGLEPMGKTPGGKTTAEKLEGIAFTFCKAATVVLIAGRFALPVAAGLASIFYVATYFKGKKDTRCVLGHPMLAASVLA